MNSSHRTRWLLACAVTLISTAFTAAAGPPKTVGEICDGTLHDIAAAPGVVWLAQGRMVTMLDSSTGKRIGDDRLSPYPSGVTAVEHDPKTGDLVVATGETVYVHAKDGSVKQWSTDDERGIVDIKVWPGGKKVFIVHLLQLAVLDYSGQSITKVSSLGLPRGLAYMLRVRIAEVDDKLMAFVMGQLKGQRRRWQHGLAIADLDRANGFARPSFYGAAWNPIEEYGTPAASVKDVCAAPNLIGERDFAYVACGKAGQLTKLDITDPAELKLLSTWNNGGYFGEMQDCIVYDFGKGPRVLVVKNNEGFAIVDPDDGM